MEILAQPTVVLALCGVMCMVLGLMHVRRERFTTRTLVMTALLLALAVVLQQLRLWVVDLSLLS